MGIRRVLRGVITVALVSGGIILIGSGLLGGFLGPDLPENAPSDGSMRLTIPNMDRVEDAAVYTSTADDTSALDAGALHVAGTGYPWETGANVYIAGHRLGYAGTGSFLLFYDLNKLENGDPVVLTDTDGTEYTYQVFNEFVADPSDTSVTQPVGSNIVSLQTCTLPDYTKRLVVQAELVSVA